MRLLISQLVILLVACQLAAPAIAENWSQFRGANGDGVVSDAKLPVEWGPKNQAIVESQASGRRLVATNRLG